MLIKKTYREKESERGRDIRVRRVLIAWNSTKVSLERRSSTGSSSIIIICLGVLYYDHINLLKCLTTFIVQFL